MACLLFKTYFKVRKQLATLTAKSAQVTAVEQLRALALCKNIRRAIDTAGDLPPLNDFPIEDQVSYRYHMGVFAFLNENFATVCCSLVQ